MRSTRLGWLLCLLLLISPSLVQAQASGCPEPRLAVGGQGRVSPGSPNRIRDTPSTSGTQVGQIPGEAVFDVLEGPTCAEGFLWWRVEFNDIEGWTVEGNADGYFVEPFDAEPVSCDVDDVPAPRLIIGQQGNVTSSTPSRIRVAPSVNAEQRGQINPFDTFVVLDGPVCADGYNWWQVRSGGVTGWVAEGAGDDYFLAPIPPTPTLPPTRTPTATPVLTPTPSITMFRRPTSVSWSADGRWLAVADYEGVWLYTSSSLRVPQRRLNMEGEVKEIEFSPADPELLAIAFAYQRDEVYPAPHLILYDVIADEVVVTLTNPSQQDGWLESISFSSDGKLLVATDILSRIATLYDTETGQRIENPILEVTHAPLSMPVGAISPDGTMLALTGQPINQLFLYETNGSSEGVELRGVEYGISTISFSPDGSRVIASDVLGNLLLWNIETGDHVAHFRDIGSSASNIIEAVAFSPDGETVVTAERSPVGIVRVFSTRGLVQIAAYGVDEANYAAVDLAFSPDGTRLAVVMWGSEYDGWHPDVYHGRSTGAVHILDTETYERVEMLIVEEN